jgi:hypothetical protein
LTVTGTALAAERVTLNTSAFVPELPSGVLASAIESDGFTGIDTVTVKVCGALVSTPPCAVPPLSWRRTVTWATLLTPGVGVNVNVPFESIAGCTRNIAGLSLLTMKFRLCPDSFGAPALMAVAQPVIVFMPVSWTAV